MGLDDVRRYNVLQRTALPCFARPADVGRPAQDVPLHLQPSSTGRRRNSADFVCSTIGGPFTLGGVEVVPIPLLHGSRPILGFRIGTFAYLTDCSRIPDESWALLAGVRTMVLDALRDRPHPTHFSVAEALEVVERLAPERTYFTHICHDLAARGDLRATARRRRVGL